MPNYTDQLGRTVHITEIPQRIISLVPSQTELIADLGALPRMAGRTKFCIHPADVRSIPVVGGTKNVHPDKIEKLRPDLIIANKEENDQSQVEELASRFPVWVSDISDLSSACHMINEVGSIIGAAEKAKSMVSAIRKEFERPVPRKGRAVYLIWRDPWMAAGHDTIISSMMDQAGFENIVHAERYPVLEMDDLKKLNPDAVLLSSEPYPFTEKHKDEIRTVLPDSRVMLVDGEMFSWYGSRLLKAAPYFRTLR